MLALQAGYNVECESVGSERSCYDRMTIIDVVALAYSREGV